MRTVIYGNRLLKDLKKTIAKLKDFEVVFVPTEKKMTKNKRLDYDYFSDYVANKLGAYMVIRNIKDIEIQTKKEALSSANFKDWLSKKHNSAQWVVELTVNTRFHRDPSGMIGWYVSVSCVGRHFQTFNKIFSLEGETGLGPFEKVKTGLQMEVGVNNAKKAREESQECCQSCCERHIEKSSRNQGRKQVVKMDKTELLQQINQHYIREYFKAFQMHFFAKQFNIFGLRKNFL